MTQFSKFRDFWSLNGQNLGFAEFQTKKISLICNSERPKLQFWTILLCQSYFFGQNLTTFKLNQMVFWHLKKKIWILITVSTLFECVFHSSCVFIYSCAMSSAIISFSDNLERIFCGLLVHVTTTIFISCSLVIKANIVLNECWFWSLTRKSRMKMPYHFSNGFCKIDLDICPFRNTSIVNAPRYWKNE